MRLFVLSLVIGVVACDSGPDRGVIDEESIVRSIHGMGVTADGITAGVATRVLPGLYELELSITAIIHPLSGTAPTPRLPMWDESGKMDIACVPRRCEFTVIDDVYPRSFHSSGVISGDAELLEIDVMSREGHGPTYDTIHVHGWATLGALVEGSLVADTIGVDESTTYTSVELRSVSTDLSSGSVHAHADVDWKGADGFSIEATKVFSSP
jgi:hypothetical protein